MTTKENVVPACRRCNAKKGNRMVGEENLLLGDKDILEKVKGQPIGQAGI
jgi:5-methylcytosine-specific restriction endonuclease McrA